MGRALFSAAQFAPMVLGKSPSVFGAAPAPRIIVPGLPGVNPGRGPGTGTGKRTVPLPTIPRRIIVPGIPGASPGSRFPRNKATGSFPGGRRF